MASSAYATLTDLGTYLKDVSTTQESTILTTLLNVASRAIDLKCGQYFYNDGNYVRYFDGEGVAEITTGQHPMFGKIGTIGAAGKGATSLTYTANPTYGGPAPAANDVFLLDQGGSQEPVTVSAVSGTGPYTLTVGATGFAHAAGANATTIQIQLAFFENQPLAQWTINLAGDGIRPGSNYFLWPRNRRSVESSAATTLARPWYGLDIATIPVVGSTFLPGSIPGKLTISITANWGWPAVPDVIKDLTCKLTARLWRAREAGWQAQLGATEIGVVKVLDHFDPLDEMTLVASDFVHLYI